MPRNPLWTILLTGLAGFLVSGIFTYQWALWSPPQPSSPSASRPEQPQNPSPDSGAEEPPTVALKADDWESFLDYEGERHPMLGIKRDYTVNIRTGPGTHYEILKTLRGGKLLKRLDRYNGWYRARLRDGTVGWIHGSLVRILRVPQPIYGQINEDLPPLRTSVRALTPPTFERHARLEVTGSVVNLRRGPGTQFKIAMRVYRHEILRMLGKSGSWYRVERRGGVRGWVHGSLLRRVGRERTPERVTVASGPLRMGPRSQLDGSYRFDQSRTVDVLDRDSPWLMVAVREDLIGWVHEQQVSPGPPAPTE